MTRSDDALLASYPVAASHPFHLLIVEDDTTVALFMQGQLQALREAFPLCAIEIVHTWEDARRTIYADPPPLVTLLDLSLPGSTMTETIARVSEIDDRTALVIITGHNRDEVLKLLGDSKVEVLHKRPDLLSPINLIRAIVRAMDRKQQSDAEERFSKVRGIVEELKRLGYGPSETT